MWIVETVGQVAQWVREEVPVVGALSAAATSADLWVERTVAGPLGLRLDETKYLAAMLAVFPLALVFRALPGSTRLRHAYCAGAGLFLSFVLFGLATWVTVASAILSYALTAWGGRHRHIVVFVTSMAVMMVCHVYRTLTDPMGWSLDFTGPQMVVTIRVTTAAFNVADGLRKGASKKKAAEEATEDTLSVAARKIHEEQERLATGMPSPLEYASYVFFFGSFLAGPALELSTYLEFVEMSVVPGAIPSSWGPTAWRMLLALAAMAATQVGTAVIPFAFVADEAFLNYPMLWRVGYHLLAAPFVRAKYFLAWFLAEAGCVAAGLGYQGKDAETGAARWSGATNIDAIGIETATSLRSAVGSWNINTARWLRRYVYNRLNPVPGRGAPMWVTAVTNLTSAFWHGTYGGYYLTFFSLAVVTNAARIARRLFRPFFISVAGEPTATKPLYDALTWLATQWSMCYFGAPFVLLSVTRGWAVWASYHHVPELVVVGFLLVTTVTGVGSKRWAMNRSMGMLPKMNE